MFKAEDRRIQRRAGRSGPPEKRVHSRPEILAALRRQLHQPLHAARRVDADTKTDDAGGNCVGILHGNATVPVRLHVPAIETLCRGPWGKMSTSLPTSSPSF